MSGIIAAVQAMSMAEVIAVILGVAYLVYLYRKAPGRVLEVGLVHLDEPDEG